MFVPERYNQYNCTSANCFYSSAEVVNIIDHIKIIHTIDPVFYFECVNRLPIRCRRKFLTFLGLQKHLKKGAVLSQWLWSWFNLKTLRAKGRRFKSPFDHPYSEKIFCEKKKFDDLWAHYHSIPLPTIWYLLS